ncbi:MAG: hypothetical protein Q9157_002560, partial [Trypethelium eluteriae]
MLASGFIVLKVANEDGEHLICGDVRKGTVWGEFATNKKHQVLGYKNVDDYGSDDDINNDNSSQYTNKKVEKQGSTRDGFPAKKIFLLKIEEINYKSLLGIYV